MSGPHSDIFALHAHSYSRLTPYYLELSERMQANRQEILNFVLTGAKGHLKEEKALGFLPLESEDLASLERTATIMDVGCATGDNLLLMQRMGYQALSGLDIAPDMLKEARRKLACDLQCGNLLELSNSASYDFVFAQAFVHLFPKRDIKRVFETLLSLMRKRLYFSTTLHDEPREGHEVKEGYNRYRSRYTLAEILAVVRALLDADPTLSFRHFFLTDPLGKRWINGLIERQAPVASYHELGVVRYRGLVDPSTIATLHPEIERLKTQRPSPGTLLRYDHAHGFDRVENFLPYCSPLLRASCRGEKVERLVEMLFGAPVDLLKDKINYKEPGRESFVAHQDAAAGWQGFGDQHLSLALAFDAAHPSNGALHFALGQHRQGLMTPLQTPFTAQQVASLRWKCLGCEPGDALFFDSYTPHWSSANRSSQARRMAFLTFNARAQGDFRAHFFAEKRRRQPPIDERPLGVSGRYDAFGKFRPARVAP